MSKTKKTFSSIYEEVHNTLIEATKCDAADCGTLIQGLSLRFDQLIDEKGRPDFDADQRRCLVELLEEISKSLDGYALIQLELLGVRLTFENAPIDDLLKQAAENTFDGNIAFQEFRRSTPTFSARTISSLVEIAFAAPGLRNDALDMLWKPEAFKHYCASAARGSASNWFEMYPETASDENLRKLISIAYATEGKDREKPLCVIDQLLRANIELTTPDAVCDLVKLLGPRETTAAASRCILSLVGYLFEALPAMARLPGLSELIVASARMEKNVSLFGGISEIDEPTYIDLIRKLREKQPEAVLMELATGILFDIRYPNADGVYVPESIDKHRSVIKACPSAVEKSLPLEMAILAAWGDSETSYRAIEYLQQLLVDHLPMLTVDKSGDLKDILLSVESIIRHRSHPLAYETACDIRELIKTILAPPELDDAACENGGLIGITPFPPKHKKARSSKSHQPVR